MTIREGSSLIMNTLILASQHSKPTGVLPFMNQSPFFDAKLPGKVKKSKVVG